MFDAAIAIRAIGRATQLRPRNAEPSVTKFIQREAAEPKVEREAPRPKSVGYYLPEWWEHHNLERR